MERHFGEREGQTSLDHMIEARHRYHSALYTSLFPPERETPEQILSRLSLLASSCSAYPETVLGYMVQRITNLPYGFKIEFTTHLLEDELLLRNEFLLQTALNSGDRAAPLSRRLRFHRLGRKHLKISNSWRTSWPQKLAQGFSCENPNELRFVSSQVLDSAILRSVRQQLRQELLRELELTDELLR